MARRKRIRKILSEEGESAVIAAVAFVAMVMLTGVVIDLGLSYSKASSLQSAADASAYAAASLLPVGTDEQDKITEITDRAIEYANKNGCPTDDVITVDLIGEVSGKYTTVSITLETEIRFIFGKILGLTGRSVERKATAQISSITESSKMVPLGMSIPTLLDSIVATGGMDVPLKYATGEEGFFGALNLSGVKGGGANSYEQWLAYGYDGVINIGDELYTEPGNMEGPTETAFYDRFNSCTHYTGEGGCTPEHFDLKCPRVLTLLLYERVSTRSVRITGFRPFILTGINAEGEILASIIDISSAGGDSVPLNETNINFGYFKVSLID